MDDNDIVEVVDEIVDDLDPMRLEREAHRLALTTEQLLKRVIAETRARLNG